MSSHWGDFENEEFPDLVMVNTTDLNCSKESSEKNPSRKKADNRKSKRSKEIRKKRARKENSKSSDEDWKWAFSSESDSDDSSSGKSNQDTVVFKPKACAKGLLMSACAGQGPDHYIKFMSVYQVK